MINTLDTLAAICLILELVLIFQYSYSLLVALHSDIFNGLTKAFVMRFLGGILLHMYLSSSLVWAFFLPGQKGYNAVVLFLMTLLIILGLLGSVNTYFYYYIKRQVNGNNNKTLRDNESSSNTSLESLDKQ